MSYFLNKGKLHLNFLNWMSEQTQTFCVWFQLPISNLQVLPKSCPTSGSQMLLWLNKTVQELGLDWWNMLLVQSQRLQKHSEMLLGLSILYPQTHKLKQNLPSRQVLGPNSFFSDLNPFVSILRTRVQNKYFALFVRRIKKRSIAHLFGSWQEQMMIKFCTN